MHSPIYRVKRVLVSGFTLVELMVSVAIVAILSGIALPAYFQYIEEAAISTTLFNLKTMRISVENSQLEDGVYPTGTFDNAEINTEIGWDPGRMGVDYDYTLVSVPAGYTIYATSLITDDVWARCENNGVDCCFSDTPGATSVTTACP